MAVRIPTIVETSQFDTNPASDTPAVIYSTAFVKPVAGRGIVSSTSAIPANGDTLVITYNNGASSATTYTFVTSVVNPRDVLIGSDINSTLENLQAEILAQDSSILDCYFSGADLAIVNKLQGYTHDASLSQTVGTTLVFDNTSALGHNGALDFDSDTFTIEINGTPTNVTIDVTQIATDLLTAKENITIDQLASDIGTSSDLDSIITGATVSVINGSPINSIPTGRIVITHDTAGAENSLEITSSNTNLFETGSIAFGSTTNHPSSDLPDTKKRIRLSHPFEPYFFRNDNRPLIDLAQNDRDIYREIVALRDGYDIDTGQEIDSIEAIRTFKAAGGIRFATDVIIEGNLIQTGGTVTQNVVNLLVSDKTITVNSGETGTGVSGSGLAGLLVDRGTVTDTSFLFNEADITVGLTSFVGSWEIDPAISGKGGTPLVVGTTIIENEQITIGDGVNTFGTYDVGAGGDLSLVLNVAISSLTNGGKIFIKRGNYIMNTDVVIDNNDILITGEGAATFIDTGANKFVIANSNSVDRVSINNIRFLTDNTTETIKLGNAGVANQTMVTNCWFEESGAGGTDVALTNSTDELLANNISTTTVTNLP